MNEKEFAKLASMVARIAYEIHDREDISAELKEMLLDLWREFDHYSQLIEEGEMEK